MCPSLLRDDSTGRTLTRLVQSAGTFYAATEHHGGERENTPPANSSEMETKFCGSTNDHGDACCVCPRCNSSFTGRSRANAFINTSRNFQALDLQLVLCSNQVNAKRAALMRKRTRKSQKPKLLSGWND